MSVRNQANGAEPLRVSDVFRRTASKWRVTADRAKSMPVPRRAEPEPPTDGLAAATAAAPGADPFLPSEYTGLLLQSLQHLPDLPVDARAAEIGIGSGVVLASLALRGIARLRGVDSHPGAIRATTALLERMGLADRAALSLGSVWEKLDGERFDLVVANLPQYPSEQPADPGRVTSWSTGGPDGRRIMDPFLTGLGAHLRPGGVALITHSTIIGLARTRAILAAQGLGCTAVLASQVLLSPGKAALLPAASWARTDQPGLREVGPYRFIEAQVLRIAAL